MPSAGGGSNISSSAQIVDEIITSADIKDGEITNADISATAAIARSKLNFGSGLVDADIAAAAAIALSKLASDPLARANHTGTQLAATISDFAAAVAAAVTNLWTVVRKAADETISNDSTLTADAALQFSMAANKNYLIRILVAWSQAEATPDFKFDITGPASPTAITGFRRYTPAGVNTLTQEAFTATYADSAGAPAGAGTGQAMVMIECFIQNGANAGTFAFRWAQNTSNGNSITVHKGSMLEYIETA